MRERLCLALLPLLGPYTGEQPRRPKGGPDGGRDIEAVFQGTIPVWGAVGFRNGGGNDSDARREAEEKFQDDLRRAKEENAQLRAFVFFTNVDLTPGIVERMKTAAVATGTPFVDIFDQERLRHTLDSPEGLIARLQYLEIPMSATEQIGLVSKFGSQLQQAVLARFDRVERTLSAMEHFLAFQKPIFRLDVFVLLDGEHHSAQIGNEAILLEFDGLTDLSKTVTCLCINVDAHPRAHTQLVMRPVIWLNESQEKALALHPCFGEGRSLMRAFCEISLTTGGHRVRIADLTKITLRAYFTAGLVTLAKRVVIDANGYELFSCAVSPSLQQSPRDLPDKTGFRKDALWDRGIDLARDLLFEPPALSGRLSPLVRI